MGKTFRSWDVDQPLLLPPSVQELVPDGHLAHFVRDTVREALDLSAILGEYREGRGYPPYRPVMMVALLLYAYCQGIYSSRRIARACEEWFAEAEATDRADDAEFGPELRGDELPEWVTNKQQRAAKMREPKPSSKAPPDKAQRNFTDPDSRIMKDSKGFEQSYNAQAAVDADGQVIVAEVMGDICGKAVSRRSCPPVPSGR